MDVWHHGVGPFDGVGLRDVSLVHCGDAYHGRHGDVCCGLRYAGQRHALISCSSLKLEEKPSDVLKTAHHETEILIELQHIYSSDLEGIKEIM